MKVVYLLLIHGLAIAFLTDRFILPNVGLNSQVAVAVNDPTPFEPVPTPPDVPTEFYVPTPDPASQASAPAMPPDSLKLIIPVSGVTAAQIQDNFTDSRSEGRVHNAIDIMAPAGTPVIAAADGKIVMLHDSVQGGITVYQLSSDGKYVYYYAHLQRRADGLTLEKFVRQGEPIGYVGDTGNAGAGNNHLHFSIIQVTDPKRYWSGININPYPILKSAGR